jgi:long-chain acyl-CoA synthetase
MPRSTFPGIMLAQAAAHPDRPALVFGAEKSTLTYGELAAQAAALAERLTAEGFRPGQGLAVPCDRSPAFFVALWGAALARLNVALLNPNLAPGDLAGALNVARPAALLADPTTLDKLGPSLTAADFTGARLAWEPAIDPPTAPSEAPTRPEDPSLIVFTSGTTGNPKGVQHTHASLFSCVAATNEAFPFEDGAVMLSLLPHFHLHGLLMTVILPVFFGGTVVVDAAFSAFSAPRFWDLVREHKVNHFSAVPGILDLLAKFHERLDRPKTPSLRFAFCASAPLSDALRRIWYDRIGCKTANNYGLSEASSWVAYGDLEGREPFSSVGRPTRCTIQILDESGNVLPPGATGEVTVQGAQLMVGYIGDPDRTGRVLRDGRLFTGDLGRLDEDGWLFLGGRQVEVINTGGLKINPSEIEGALAGLPGIKDVAAFGFPDDHLGQAPAVAVVPEGDPPTLAQVRTHLTPLLTAYKIPRKLFVVEELPRNALGKLRRVALRKKLAPTPSDA